VDAIGEMFGYAIGSGNAKHILSDMEFHRERFLIAMDKELAKNPDQITSENS
jgi:hypothetical protein